MKLSHKTSSLIALLLIALTFNANSMEQPHDYNAINWVTLTGDVLVDAAAFNTFLSYIHSEPFDFVALPQDIQKIIISLVTTNISAQSLQEAAQTINSLAQVNHELNESINQPHFCLKLIKHLAQQFNCSDEIAARALHIKAAQQRIKLQTKLYSLCFDLDRYLSGEEENMAADLQLLCNDGVDLEFIYEPNDLQKDGFYGERAKTELLTPLMTASSGGYDKVIKLLLQHNININQTNNKGVTALMIATYYISPESIKTLVGYSNINVNQQDNNGNCALIYNFTANHTNNYSTLKITEITKMLLDAGADPEIANNNGLTPLQAAQDAENNAAVQLIQDAINKKLGIK